MSVPSDFRFPLVRTLLFGTAILFASATMAQDSGDELDKRLQQLEKLEKSGLYTDEEIADAKKKLLESVVNFEPSNAFARESRPSARTIAEAELYEAYRQRLRDRREDALDLRRQYSLTRPPARGWLAIRLPFPNTIANMIERGWVEQPPIPLPRRRYLVVPYEDYGYDDYYDDPYADYPRDTPRL